jgi:hypothetical protein
MGRAQDGSLCKTPCLHSGRSRKARFASCTLSKDTTEPEEQLWMETENIEGANYSLTQLTYFIYRGADKSLARPTSRFILFDGENISFDASLLIYINSSNIPPIMIINRIYEHQNLLSL